MQIVEELITQLPPSPDHDDIEASGDVHAIGPNSCSESVGIQVAPCRRNIRTQVKPCTKGKGIMKVN